MTYQQAAARRVEGDQPRWLVGDMPHAQYMGAHMMLYSKNLWVKTEKGFNKLEDSIDGRREHFLMFSMGGEMGGI